LGKVIAEKKSGISRKNRGEEIISPKSKRKQEKEKNTTHYNTLL